jgi:hypothetical protein
MDYIGLIITLIILGVIFYLVNRFIIAPYVSEPFKTFIYVVVAIFALLWFLCAAHLYCYSGLHAH